MSTVTQSTILRGASSRPVHDDTALPKWWVLYLMQCEPTFLLCSALCRLMWSGCALSCAYFFVGQVIERTGDGQDIYLICMGYLFAAICLSLSAQGLGFFGGELGSRVKARLASLVAQHALLRAAASQKNMSLALTLSSSDAHVIYDGAMQLNHVWAAPVEATVIIALLIQLVGPSGWISFAVAFVVIVTIYANSLIMRGLRARCSALQSKQVSLFFEVLQNVRPFRFYGWDAFFLRKLNKLTDELESSLLKMAFFKSANLSLVLMSTGVMSIVIYSSFSRDNGFLPPKVAFICLSLFNTFRFPLMVLPNALAAYSAASHAYNRIRDFMNSESAEDGRMVSQTPGAVELENLPVGPKGTILENWQARPGEMWIFQGPVHSFKSTLIETIAGHYPIPSSAIVRVGGRVSYAKQQPWLQQATIKDNIVCCEPWDPVRYDKVIFACALTLDLASMPLGDDTPVAEKGISLSGGQRQRVAFARAVYRVADVYLLDCPLASLDDQTQEHIWTHVMEGLLKSATVIVASSRPVLSCTAVLNLSTNGVCSGDFAITKVNGPVVPTASSVVPPRYLNKFQLFNIVSSSATTSVKSSNVAMRSEAVQPSRGIVLKRSLEDAAVADVKKEIESYDLYAEALEQFDVGVPNSSHNIPSSHDNDSNSIRASFATLALGNNSRSSTSRSSTGRSSTSRSRTHSRVQNLFEGHFDAGQRYSCDAAIPEVSSQNISLIANSRTGAPEKDVLQNVVNGPTVQHHSTHIFADSSFKKQSRHGLRLWAEAGGNARWLMTILCYPISQSFLIFAYQNLRWWSGYVYNLEQHQYLAIYIGLISGCLLFTLARDFLFYRFSVLAATKLRRELCAAIINAPMIFFMTENLGPLTEVFTKDLGVLNAELSDAIHMALIYLCIGFANMVSICAQFIEKGSPYFLLTCVFVISASVALQIRYAKKVHTCRVRFQKSNDDVFHCLSDYLDGVKILRTAEETSWSISILSDAFKESRVCAVANEKCTLWLMARVDAMAVVLTFLACILSVTQKLEPGPKGLSVSGSLQILVFYSWMMRNIAAAIYSSGSVDRIHDYINGIPQEIRTGDALQKDWPKFGDIEFLNVDFKYAPAFPLALNKVSFRLPHASKVGIVGRTGSGKSTLLVALFRLIQPLRGAVIVDNCSTLSADLDALRSQIGIIPQDPAMFAGTLRENIDPFERYSDDEVSVAIAECGLEHRSMDSTVGVSGENFSLGEKQLVCLARVVLKNPALLALDEATANLDEQTEKVFQKVLEEKFKDATILCVAHRLEPLRWCRTKIEIGAGKLLSISDCNVAQLPVVHPADVQSSAPESSFQSRKR